MPKIQPPTFKDAMKIIDDEISFYVYKIGQHPEFTTNDLDKLEQLYARKQKLLKMVIGDIE